jgi:hypothetical protein
VQKYRVLGRGPLVARIQKALEESGARIISAPSPAEAPFEFVVDTPDGDRLILVCYAFLANKYRQGGRPADEHRFQIKYGSDFQSYHELFMDPKRERITLMFGVHIEEDLFVAVDPAMYNPTWFSRSVEFKTADLERTRSTGWYGWERERSAGRRKLEMPLASSETEAVLGFTPENFIRYALFEQIATGMDAGERLLLVERMGALKLRKPAGHPLEQQFGLSAREILDIIWGRFRLGAAVRGGVAEHHLGRLLETVPGISKVQRFDEDGRPDFEVTYKRRPYLIECKNVLRKPSTRGPRVDFQKTRASKGDPCSRYYERAAFEVLAACLHPITERWEFRFACTSRLEPHSSCTGRLSPHVVVAGGIWVPDVGVLFDAGCCAAAS